MHARTYTHSKQSENVHIQKNPSHVNANLFKSMHQMMMRYIVNTSKYENAYSKILA